MSHGWSHPMCEVCWETKHPGGREPVRVAAEEVEICCWCGGPTAGGIYVREDPQYLRCRELPD